MNFTNGPFIGFLHPAKMTLDERMDELTSIFATAFLRLRTRMAFPESQGKTAGSAQNKAAQSSLELGAKPRLCGSRKGKIL